MVVARCARTSGFFILDSSLTSTYICANIRPIRGRTAKDLLIRFLMMRFLRFLGLTFRRRQYWYTSEMTVCTIVPSNKSLKWRFTAWQHRRSLIPKESLWDKRKIPRAYPAHEALRTQKGIRQLPSNELINFSCTLLLYESTTRRVVDSSRRDTFGISSGSLGRNSRLSLTFTTTYRITICQQIQYRAVQ